MERLVNYSHLYPCITVFPTQPDVLYADLERIYKNIFLFQMRFAYQLIPLIYFIVFFVCLFFKHGIIPQVLI